MVTTAERTFAATATSGFVPPEAGAALEATTGAEVALVAGDGVAANPESEPATIATVASEARRLETTEVATIGPRDLAKRGRRIGASVGVSGLVGVVRSGALGGLVGPGGMVGRGSSSICDRCRTAA
jgi:hypothetical protein